GRRACGDRARGGTHDSSERFPAKRLCAGGHPLPTGTTRQTSAPSAARCEPPGGTPGGSPATSSPRVVDDLARDLSPLHVLTLRLLHQQLHGLVLGPSRRGDDDALGLLDRRPG